MTSMPDDVSAYSNKLNASMEENIHMKNRILSIDTWGYRSVPTSLLYPYADDVSVYSE